MASSSSCDPSCPICLEPLKPQQAYLDRCFHSFCYNCIVRWSKLVSRKKASPLLCPLCKVENFSIIHAFNGESFQRHYVNQSVEKSFISTAHEFRLQCYNKEVEDVVDMFNVKQYWKCRKYLKQNIWLQSWLRREIQALIQEEDVDIIMHHVHGVVESFIRRQDPKDIKAIPERKCQGFRDLVSNTARPFLHGKTEHFVTELEMFLASGLNLEAYDEVYMQCLGAPSQGGECDEYSHGQSLQTLLVHFLGEDEDKAD